MTETDRNEDHTESTGQTAAGGPGRWRAPLAAFLTVVAALSLVLAVTATWMRTTLLNTDAWVAAVEDLPANPELQELIATRVANEALTLIDLPSLLDDAIGPVGRFLSIPVENASRGFIENATTRVVASPQFETIWVEANRAAHEEAVRILRGETVVDEVENTVSFDLAPVINNVVAKVSEDAPELFGGAISIPEVSADQVDGAAANLAAALGVTIPPDFGKVTVFDSDSVASAQRAVQLLDGGLVALWVLVGLSLVGALVATLDRRRTVAALGVVTAVGAVGVWMLREPLENDIVNAISDPSGRAVARVVADVALWNSLGPLVWALVIVALVAAGSAFLVGPSASAESFRRTMKGLGGDDHPQTATSLFLRRHIAAFRIAGVGAAVIALFSLSNLTWGWFLTITIVLGAYELAWMYVVPHEPPASADAAPEPG